MKDGIWKMEYERWGMEDEVWKYKIMKDENDS